MVEGESPIFKVSFTIQGNELPNIGVPLTAETIGPFLTDMLSKGMGPGDTAVSDIDVKEVTGLNPDNEQPNTPGSQYGMSTAWDLKDM